MHKQKKDFFIIFHDDKNSQIRKREFTVGSIILFFIILFLVSLFFFNFSAIYSKIKKSILVSLSIQNEINKLSNTEKILSSLNDSINSKLIHISKIDSQVQQINSVLAPDLNKSFYLNSAQDSVYLNLDFKTHLLVVKDMELTFMKLIKLYNKNNHLVTNYPTQYPVKKIKIVRYYGLYKDPYTKELKPHYGVDFLGSIGDTVFSVANGRVSGVIKKRYKGLVMLVQHTDSLVSMYTHLDKILVSTNNEVKKGEPIALLGNSGKSMYPHLHLEIIEKDSSVDPMNYLIESDF